MPDLAVLGAERRCLHCEKCGPTCTTTNAFAPTRTGRIPPLLPQIAPRSRTARLRDPGTPELQGVPHLEAVENYLHSQVVRTVNDDAIAIDDDTDVLVGACVPLHANGDIATFLEGFVETRFQIPGDKYANRLRVSRQEVKRTKKKGERIIVFFHGAAISVPGERSKSRLPNSWRSGRQAISRIRGRVCDAPVPERRRSARRLGRPGWNSTSWPRPNKPRRIMAKTILIEEFHITVRTSASLSKNEQLAIRRTISSKRFQLAWQSDS